MVELKFDFRGYLFESGITNLRQSYDAAVARLFADKISLQHKLEAYLQDIENGREQIGEWTDDGYPIWTQDRNLEWEIESIDEVAADLRKTFVLALYHHWERSVRSWVEDDKSSHDELVNAARKIGVPIHEGLKKVHRLNNALKHDNNRKGHQLLEVWPELFTAGFKHRLAQGEDSSVKGNRLNWYEAIQFGGEGMDEVFSIIEKSGLKTK